jgi:hypothetical protein
VSTELEKFELYFQWVCDYSFPKPEGADLADLRSKCEDAWSTHPGLRAGEWQMPDEIDGLPGLAEAKLEHDAAEVAGRIVADELDRDLEELLGGDDGKAVTP